MPISHTNRKGHAFFLCQGLTKTGKTRYFFSKTALPDALEQIPAGYHIEESVNGIVSLVKDRTQPIRPEEVQLVEQALRRCPTGNNYRVSAKGRRIIVYERIGPQAEDLAGIFDDLLPTSSRRQLVAIAQDFLDQNAQYRQMLHFNLVDPANRTFSAERVTYSSSLPEWVTIYNRAPLPVLVAKIIPLLDTDEYFELFLELF